LYHDRALLILPQVGDETGGRDVKEAVKSPAVVSFSVGDVVWTKVCGSPWWPCMVSTDPELEQHAKPKHRGNLLFLFVFVSVIIIITRKCNF